MSPRYLASCFLLVFLEGWWSTLFLSGVSLYLGPTIWDPSASSKRVTSFSSTLSQNYWRYFNVLFFFSSSTTFFLSASFLTLASTSFLAFWIVYSAWRDFTASSNWIRNHCFSSCLCYISCHCFSSTLASFWKMLEWMGDDMVIQRKRQKKFCLYIVDLDTIMGFLDKFNKTSKAQSQEGNTIIYQVHSSRTIHPHSTLLVNS